MRRARTAVVVVLGAALAFPAAAVAQLEGGTSVRGVTGQKRDITFTADVDGRTGDLVVEWDARCRNGTRFAPQTTTFEAPPQGAGRRVIAGTGRYRVPERGGRIARVTALIDGRRTGSSADPARQIWSGTLRIRAVMRRHGRLTDVCTLRTRWRAGPQGFGAGTWEVRADAPRPGSPPFHRRDPAGWTMSASGTRDAVSLSSRATDSQSWSASFRAPTLNRLEPGRTYTPSEVSGGADMSVDDAAGSGCSDVSFTVESIAFDELKRLAALRVAYVRDCGSGFGGLWRGVVDWRATR